MYKTLTITLSLLLFFINIPFAQSFSEKDVFLLNVKGSVFKKNKENDSKERICPSNTLTGFRIKVGDKVGIVTALHGLVGCNKITAVGHYKKLKITQADIKRDVAFLYSSELENASSQLEPEQHSQYEGLYVIGHPLGITAQMRSEKLRIRQPPREKFEDLLPRTLYDLFNRAKKRGSPQLKVDVLSIEGHILPGHSGAPIFNGEDKVVGVANGGLEKGHSEIVWAIPWHDIKWQPHSYDSVLKLLGNKPKINSSFSISLSEEEFLSIKIVLIDTEKREYPISKKVYKKRVANYYLSIPQEVNPEKIKQIRIMKGNEVNEVFALGKSNVRLFSTDQRYEFLLSNNSGFLILTVNPLWIASPIYRINLSIPGRMNGADIFVNDEPVTNYKEIFAGIILRVKGKESPHHIVLKKGDYCCSIKRLIRQNDLILSPCLPYIKLLNEDNSCY